MPPSPSQSRYEAEIAESVKAGASLIETGTSASASPTSPTLRNPANKLWTQKTQREVFIQHLKNWASNHDSSTYFHGSISLHPQGAIPGEVVELGKSVNCILTNASSVDTPKKIVVRLFQSQRHDGHVRRQKVLGKKDPVVSSDTASLNSTTDNGSHHHKVQTLQSQSIAPYQLVIRSGSGWVPARLYLDKHYFAHLPRPDPPVAPQRPAWVNLTTDTLNWNTINRNLEPSTPSKQPDQNTPLLIHSRHTGSPPSAKDTVTISPLFRPFLRLPQELQDEILYQAVGYTRCISLTHTLYVRDAALPSESPISISKLFRISKAINEHMVAYIFRSTNFHFGITGFTKFLWQLGPTNRSNLQHLTFHFGKASLLHCIRWLAPDPIYEMFEPPVTTVPANLTYFWRCQLQDLMKELNLLTLTIDIRDVPLADVPMLVRVLSTAIGSIERIRVIDNHVRTGILIEEHAQDLLTRFKYMPEVTWRELSVRYHSDYKHQRWHMRHVWAIHGVDLHPLLDIWMDKEKAFFDS